jgi:CubicO group peptidase (beta-lactamase class C family)
MMSTLNKPARPMVLLLTLLLMGLTAVGQTPTAPIERYLADLASKDQFSGAILVALDGKVVFARGYGKANEEFEVPNTPAIRFRLGSITKQFTAAAILKLEEQGKLLVTDPICQYLRDCPPTWSAITIHHLLSHTGGIRNFTALPTYLPAMHAPVTNDQMIARFRDLPLDFPPGSKWSYSNSGYFLLGVIIEQVSGESYESYLKRHFFDPLGMPGSGYDRHLPILRHRATGYAFVNGARVNSPYLDMSQPAAAGALYSTVEDLYRWNEALFEGRALSPRSFQSMTTPVLNGYGYGVSVAEILGRRTVSHGGGINGFNTFLIRYLAEKATIVVLRNRDYGTPAPNKIAETIATLLFGEKSAPAPSVK